jgi:pimeloyl-ACP methyl ester carboxylesterase
MNRPRWIAAGMGLLMVLISIWQLETADSGLEVTHVRAGDLPVTLISPAEEEDGNRPIVLIGHGVAGSRVIMEGYALTLAHAGYNVALWDFAGHGSNLQPLPVDRDEDTLVADAEVALKTARDNGFQVERTAVLGHSMGSGMALTYGVVHPETMVTIAVSPVTREVTPELPRNLLLLAEGLDQRFVRNGERLLDQAGGAGGDPAVGRARKMVVIPGVEHITILFSPTAHKAARQWLDNTFGPQTGAEDYTDRRILWYSLGLVGTLLFFWSLAKLIGDSSKVPDEPRVRPLWWRIGSLVGGALGATLSLFALSKVGLQLPNLLGILVGGYLLVWFVIAGVVSLLLMGFKPSRLERPALLASLMVFSALWVGVGYLGSYVWLPWMLIPERLWLWLLGAILILPWLLAVGQAVLPTGRLGRAVWWFVYSVILLGGLFLALSLNPELGFLILILPVFPVVLGLHALAAGPYRWRWTFTLGGALFLSWIVIAVFPLQ